MGNRDFDEVSGYSQALPLSNGSFMVSLRGRKKLRLQEDPWKGFTEMSRSCSSAVFARSSFSEESRAPGVMLILMRILKSGAPDRGAASARDSRSSMLMPWDLRTCVTARTMPGVSRETDSMMYGSPRGWTGPSREFDGDGKILRRELVRHRRLQFLHRFRGAGDEHDDGEFAAQYGRLGLLDIGSAGCHAAGEIIHYAAPVRGRLRL